MVAEASLIPSNSVGKEAAQNPAEEAQPNRQRQRQPSRTANASRAEPPTPSPWKT